MLLGCPESTFIAAHELCKAFLHSVEVACMGLMPGAMQVSQARRQ